MTRSSVGSRRAGDVTPGIPRSSLASRSRPRRGREVGSARAGSSPRTVGSMSRERTAWLSHGDQPYCLQDRAAGIRVVGTKRQVLAGFILPAQPCRASCRSGDARRCQGSPSAAADPKRRRCNRSGRACRVAGKHLGRGLAQHLAERARTSPCSQRSSRPRTWYACSMPVRNDPGSTRNARNPIGSISCHSDSVKPSSANLLEE